MRAARNLISAIKKGGRRAAQSPWMSVAAAAAVVLGTVGTYVSGNIAAAAQTCDVRRELLLVNGSPDLHLGRATLLRTSEARAYLTLAFGTLNLEQRREYAYLGVTAANNAIISTPSNSDAQIALLPYPTDRELSSLRYMTALADKVNSLDITQLAQTLKVHDKNMERQLSELAECDQLGDVGGMIGGLAVLFSLLSVSLIGLREYHQAKQKPRRRSDPPSA